MNVGSALRAFVTVFFAELPDKTMFATIVMSARYRRHWPVWIGAAAALTLQMLIASAAGRLLDLLPDRPVKIGVAVLFAIGAVVLFRSARAGGDESIDTVAETRPLPGWRIAVAVFGVLFVAEWGDLTQIATASLAASGNAASVFVGAALAMITVAGIGVVAGRALLRVVSERTLKYVASGIFAVLAAIAAVEAARAIDLTGRLGFA